VAPLSEQDQTEHFIDRFLAAVRSEDAAAARQLVTDHPEIAALIDKIKSFGHKNAMYAPNFEMIESYIIANAKEGDAVVVMGAGNVTKLSDTLSERFSRTA